MVYISARGYLFKLIMYNKCNQQLCTIAGRRRIIVAIKSNFYPAAAIGILLYFIINRQKYCIGYLHYICTIPPIYSSTS